MNVSKDFEELFELFNGHKVKALVVGGYAFSFHAKPRYTKDIDILVEPSVENAQRLIAALEEFGFGGLGLSAEDFSKPGQIIQLGHAPARVDLLTSIKGIDFERAWEGRVKGRFGSQQVFYIGLDDLIRNKKAVNRPLDRADVSVLEGLRKSDES